MNKNVSHISSRIMCPKCRTQSMRKSVEKHPKFDLEYFCDKDHCYFGIFELVHEWGYDAADFISDSFVFPDKVLWERIKLAVASGSKIVEIPPTQEQLIRWWGEDSISPDVEAVWSSKSSRDEDYETVTKMQLDIPAWGDGCGNDLDLYEFATGR